MAWLAFAGPVSAQGIVRGAITNDQGRRLPGVELSVAELSRTVRTDSAGEYKLVLPPGRYWVNVRALGYFVVGDSIEPEKDVELIHDFTLSSFGITLDTVTTTAVRKTYFSSGLQGFEQRRRLGYGKFISEEEFRQAANRLLSDVLRKVPGMTVVPSRGSAYFAVASRRSACPLTVFLDGLLLYDRGISRAAGPPDLTQYQTGTFAGAEYYASTATAPAQFRDRSGCGLLLLWTRER
jgi:hypothetical protein